MNIVRKVRSNGEINMSGLLKPSVMYGIIVVPGAIRFKPFKNGDHAHIVKTYPFSFNTTISELLRDISGFMPGTKFRVDIEEDYVVIFTENYSGNGTEFDRVHVETFNYCVEPSDFKKAAASKTEEDYKIVYSDSVGNLVLRDAFEKVGIPGNAHIVMTIFQRENRHWIEVRRLEDEDSYLPPLKGFRTFFNTFAHSDMQSVSFRTQIKPYFRLYLPASFRNLVKDDGYPVWIDDRRGRIIIESSLSKCAISGETIRSTLPHETVRVCADCDRQMKAGNISILSEAIMLQNYEAKAAEDITPKKPKTSKPSKAPKAPKTSKTRKRRKAS